MRTGVTSTILLVATVPGICLAAFVPSWQVGDWWVTKTNHIVGKVGWRLQYDYLRYDVIRTDSVDGHQCYVVRVEYRDHATTPREKRDTSHISNPKRVKMLCDRHPISGSSHEALQIGVGAAR